MQTLYTALGALGLLLVCALLSFLLTQGKRGVHGVSVRAGEKDALPLIQPRFWRVFWIVLVAWWRLVLNTYTRHQGTVQPRDAEELLALLASHGKKHITGERERREEDTEIEEEGEDEEAWEEPLPLSPVPLEEKDRSTFRTLESGRSIILADILKDDPRHFLIILEGFTRRVHNLAQENEGRVVRDPYFVNNATRDTPEEFNQKLTQKEWDALIGSSAKPGMFREAGLFAYDSATGGLIWPHTSSDDAWAKLAPILRKNMQEMHTYSSGNRGEERKE